MTTEAVHAVLALQGARFNSLLVDDRGRLDVSKGLEQILLRELSLLPESNHHGFVNGAADVSSGKPDGKFGKTR